MRVALTLTLCVLLATGSQAGFLDGLTDTFTKIGGAVKDTFKAVGGQAKVLGGQLLTQLKTQGGQLASQALQSLALNAMNALTSSSSSSTKRDLDLHKIADEAHDLVANHMDMLQGVLTAAVSKLQDIPNHMGPMSVEEIVDEIERIVQSHNGLVDKVEKNMIQGLVEKFAHVLQPHSNKRGFSDALNSVAQSFGNFFQPHLNTLKNLLSGTGQALKETVYTMNNVTDPHNVAIQGSLHEMAHHGANALQALKEALSSTLQTTLVNMAPHIQNIVNHGAAQLSQAVGTFQNKLSQHMQQPASTQQ